ncbi:MAG TPA: DNA polymerase III subunit beta [Candidatus Paceibacterota bacterium]
MKLIVLHTNLKNGLGIVSRALGEGSNLPILKNVSIKTLNNKIRLVTTNLELAATHYVSGKIIEEGSITVPFSILYGIVSNCDSERITLEVKNNTLYFQTDNYNAQIQGLPEEEFPIIPKITNDKNYIIINAELLKSSLLKVVSAVQISEIRPEISGVLFNFQLTHFKVVGTDSFRLAEKTISEKDFKSNFQRGFQVIIPIKTIQEVIRVMNNGDVGVYIDPNQILFKTEEVEIISRLIDGAYPEYEAIIPKEFSIECDVSQESFMNAVKLVSNVTGKTNDIILKTKEGKKVLEVYSVNQFVGENRYLVPAKIKGKEFEVAFNWRYLIDGLKNFESEEIYIGVNQENRPVLLRTPNDFSYFYLLMPIKN